MFGRIVAGILGVLFLFACADNQTGPALNPDRNQNTAVGILQGTVTIGPICPVESVEDPCLPDPSLFTSHKLVILSKNGNEVQQVDIDSKGNYRTELIAGTYTVDFRPHDIGLPGSFEPPEAEIRQGETTILNIDIDTGIR